MLLKKYLISTQTACLEKNVSLDWIRSTKYLGGGLLLFYATNIYTVHSMCLVASQSAFRLQFQYFEFCL